MLANHIPPCAFPEPLPIRTPSSQYHPINPTPNPKPRTTFSPAILPPRYLAEARGETGPHIVIGPKSVIGNWCNEFARWCPSLRVVKLLGDKATRASIVAEQVRDARRGVYQ